MHTRALWVGALLIGAMGACSDRDVPSATDAGTAPEDGATSDVCTPGGPAIVCDGESEITCRDGAEASTRDCRFFSQMCVPDLGCAACEPGSGRCDGNTPESCRADGSGWQEGAACDRTMGESCNPATGMCEHLCSAAEESSSYIGCEYWPTPVLNSKVSRDFDFAVVVANPHAMPADVTVTRGEATVATVRIASGGIETIVLPWVDELKGDAEDQASALVSAGAYRLRSSVPVTVYQFNALDYRIPRDCSDEDLFSTGDEQCFSLSNDASLLLPTHVLTGSYSVLSRAAMLYEVDQGFGPQQTRAPGYFTVIGVEETPVEVTLDVRAHVQGGTAVGDMVPGGTATFTLEQGDVLQIVSKVPTTCTPGATDMDSGATIRYCDTGADYDLTGSEIRASGRVAVISGHDCAFVPYDRWACDHLEEAMFPLESWGKDYLIAATEPLRDEPNVIRIVSGHDANTIGFQPASVHAEVTLDRGEMIELEASEDFRVLGDEAFMVAQFLVGQDYAGYDTSGDMGQGDPAFSLAIPIEQLRDSYTFLAPSTYDVSYVNVMAAAGQAVMLDGEPVTGWRNVGSTGMATARVMIAGGAHEMGSASPFGVVVYGFGAYTSYMYPGGLDFEEINAPF